MTDPRYFPAANAWDKVDPRAANYAPDKLAAAVAFAQANETPWPRGFYYDDGRYAPNVDWNETGPWSAVLGPVRERGGSAGLVLQSGRVLAAWGEIARADMTFSIAKSYLAVLTGLAVDDGLIGDIDEPVGTRVPGPLFADAHNAKVTWRHLLEQTSEWRGELFGKPDQIDHNRLVAPNADNSRKGELREWQTPGNFYEYNDVRRLEWKAAAVAGLGRRDVDAVVTAAELRLPVVAEPRAACQQKRAGDGGLRVRGRRQHDLDRSRG
jgi:hypothetical protein